MSEDLRRCGIHVNNIITSQKLFTAIYFWKIDNYCLDTHPKYSMAQWLNGKLFLREQ